MDDFDKLELSTETLRELTQDELAHVAGGAGVTLTCPPIAPTIIVLTGVVSGVVTDAVTEITRACA